MKARIIKKLSKKVAELAPTLFKGAWIDDEIMELAFEQGSRVSHVLCVGGDLDYYGEASSEYTCWEWFIYNYMWIGDFPVYEPGHQFEGYPDISLFKCTTKTLLSLAAQLEKEALLR